MLGDTHVDVYARLVTGQKIKKTYRCTKTNAVPI